MKLFINWKSSRRENTLLTILIDNRLTVTCQHNADTSKANMIWKSIRSYVTNREESRNITVPQEQHMKVWPFTLQKTDYKPVTEEGFQDATEVENLSQRRRQKAPTKNEPTTTKSHTKSNPTQLLSKTSPAKQMVGEWPLYKCQNTKDTRKNRLALLELPELVAQARNLTVDTSFPFAEFGILTIPFLPDYMQICKELTFLLTGNLNPTEINRVQRPKPKYQTPKYLKIPKEFRHKILKVFWLESSTELCWVPMNNQSELNKQE